MAANEEDVGPVGPLLPPPSVAEGEAAVPRTKKRRGACSPLCACTVCVCVRMCASEGIRKQGGSSCCLCLCLCTFCARA
jgi:hypothetical protein